MSVPPIVRHLIVCEDIIVSNDQRVSLINLVGTLRSTAEPSFPFLREELCIFVSLTECRGEGDLWVEIAHAESNALVYRSQVRRLRWGPDPLASWGLRFRTGSCVFSEPGLYAAYLWYNQAVIGSEPFIVE